MDASRRGDRLKLFRLLMPKKIAIVCRLAEGLSGATSMIFEHARRLKEAGWEVHVYAQLFNRRALEEAGARLRWVAGWPWGSSLKRRIFAARADRLAGRGGHDLIHGYGDSFFQDVLSLHNCVHAAHEAVYASPLPDNSAVGRLHARILSGEGFKKLIANYRLMKEDVVRRFAVAPEKIIVIYPGYDSKRFNAQARLRLRAQARQELGYSG